MNAASLINPFIERDSKDLWIVCTGNGLQEQGLFRDLSQAFKLIEDRIALGISYKPDFKHERCDDITDLPLGSITQFSWSCPLRPMTKQEVRNHPNKMFTKDWLKLPPTVPDFEKAENAGVRFLAEKTEHILITRVSRHIGYLRRAGALNDKRKAVTALNALYDKMTLKVDNQD